MTVSFQGREAKFAPVMNSSVSPVLLDRPRRSAGRPTLQAATELEQALLDAAEAEFMTKGYRAASVEGIARAAGINKDTVYRKFGNKSALFLAVSHRAMAQFRQRLQELAVAQGDPQEVLLAYILRIYDELSAPRARDVIRMVISEAPHFPELSDLVADCQGNLTSLEDYLAELVKAGVLTLTNPKEAASQLANHTTGGIMLFLALPLQDPADKLRWACKVRDFLLCAWQYQVGACEPTSA